MDRLSFEIAATLCRELVGVGDEIFGHAQRLKEAGFSAFEPFITYLEEFCQGENEIRDHREYVVASAKNTLGTPWPMSLRANAQEKALFYESPTLKALQRRRDELNGVPLEHLGEKYPGEKWRLEIDPSRRRMFQLMTSDRMSYELRRKEMLNEQSESLRIEAKRKCSDVVKSYSFDRKGRQGFFKCVMQREAANVGFSFDYNKSSEKFIIYSKRIVDQWDLCLTLEDPTVFFLNSAEGQFAPSLQIRHKSLVGSIDAEDVTKFLLIRYRHLIPGFGIAYWIFNSLEELELLIKAHLFLLRLMSQKLDAALDQGFKQVLGQCK